MLTYCTRIYISHVSVVLMHCPQLCNRVSIHVQVWDTGMGLTVLDDQTSSESVCSHVTISSWQTGGIIIIEKSLPHDCAQCIRHGHHQPSGTGHHQINRLKDLGFHIRDCKWGILFMILLDCHTVDGSSSKAIPWTDHSRMIGALRLNTWPPIDVDGPTPGVWWQKQAWSHDYCHGNQAFTLLSHCCYGCIKKEYLAICNWIRLSHFALTNYIYS